MTQQQLKVYLLEGLKFLATIGGLLFVVVLFLAMFQHATAAEFTQESRPANVVCAELGAMAVDATSLIFTDSADKIIEKLQSKYVQSARYVPFILKVVLTPPIMDPKQMQMVVVRECLKNKTTDS